MKKWLVVGSAVLLFSARGVEAHPFDEMGDVKTYDQKQILEVGRDKTILQVDVTLYALDKIKVWEGIDRNKDREISDGERKEWMKKGQEASWMEIDGARFGFEAVAMEVADYYEFFSPEPAKIRIEFWVDKSLALGQSVVYHYEGKDKKLEEIELVVKGGGKVTKISEEAVGFEVRPEGEAVLGVTTNNRLNNFLDDYVKVEDLPARLVVFALAVSFVLGALHALTPGHGKAIVASYLVGSKGTIWHAINLGLIVTVTHTASVFLLGLASVWLTAVFVPSKVIKTLNVVSGVSVLLLGLYLLVKRTQKIFAKNHEHDHTHRHEEVEISWKNLIPLGVSGGIVPCVDALAILIVAISLGKTLFGLALLMVFSLGLAVALGGIGVAAVLAKNQLGRRIKNIEGMEKYVSLVSAGVVTLLGLGILLNFGI